MKILFASICAFLSFFSFSQTNYFVSVTGNNSNTGTLAQPWQTIQFGLNQLNANDTLNILTGIYNEKVFVPISNVYVRNHFANTPIIDATGLTNQNAIVALTNLSNVSLEGLELQNNSQNDAQGILVEGSGSNITIKKCKLHDIHFSSNPLATVDSSTNAQGIIVYGTNGTAAITNLTITENELYNCRLGYSEGIAVNGNVSGFEVSKNLVYNLSNIGIVMIGHEGNCPNPINDQARNGAVFSNTIHDCISPYATCGGIYIDGAQLITIENNTSYHNGYGIEIGCENIGKTSSDNTVRNNLLYDNEVAGIALGGFDYPAGSGKVTTTTVRNNTCFSNDFSISGNGELLLSYSENCVLENNIFYTSNQNVLGSADLSQPGISFNYNTIFCIAGQNMIQTNWNGTTYLNYSSFVSGSSTNSNSVFGDPIFSTASISSPNFHVNVGSAAINSGNPAYVNAPNEFDLDGENRINGLVDCGADEYYSTTGIQESDLLNFTIFPNPATDFLNVQSLEKNVPVEIYNSNGILELSTSVSYDHRIDLRSLPLGLYFIHLNGKLSNHQSFIKL